MILIPSTGPSVRYREPRAESPVDVVGYVTLAFARPIDAIALAVPPFGPGQADCVAVVVPGSGIGVAFGADRHRAVAKIGALKGPAIGDFAAQGCTGDQPMQLEMGQFYSQNGLIVRTGQGKLRGKLKLGKKYRP